MKARRVESDIQNFLDLVVHHGLAQLTQPLQKISTGSALRLIAQGSKASQQPLTLKPFASLGEYRHFVENEAYSVLLNDGGLLNFSFDFRDGKLSGHRLLYYPCPFDIDETLLEEEPILDLIDLYLASAHDGVRLRSPLRFDYDPKNAKPDHPSVHVHMHDEGCRCPVVAPISLGRFIGFVFRHFYAGAWKEHEFLRRWRTPSVSTTISDDESEGIHIAFRNR